MYGSDFKGLSVFWRAFYLILCLGKKDWSPQPCTPTSPVEPLSLCRPAEFGDAKLGLSACPVATSDIYRRTSAQGWDLWPHPDWFSGVGDPEALQS